MYWNNPIVRTTVQSGLDVIQQAQHQGRHCVFFDPAVNKTQICVPDKLQHVCDLANAWARQLSQCPDPGDKEKITNLVRINQFVHSLQTQGNLKPLLLHFLNGKLCAATGGTRIMAAERLPQFATFPAFVSTHVDHRSRFAHCIEVQSLSHWAAICGAAADTEFLFRLTDEQADYGVDWYEVALQSTFVPSHDQCQQWLEAYLQANPGTVFAPDWFDQTINWTVFDHQAAKSAGH